MNNIERLFSTVIDHSESKIWESAILEWEVVDYKERPHSQCICGHSNIKYCYTIFNNVTGIYLYPIGSVCIKKFGNENLDYQMDLMLRINKLKKEFEVFVDYEKIKDILNQNLIDFFKEKKVFENDEEYEFISRVLSSKKKEPSIGQEKWLKGILFYKIKPFLMNYGN